MTKLRFITIFLLFVQSTYFAQNESFLYTEGLKKIDSAKYTQAIDLFDKHISTHKKDYQAFYYRGVAKLKLKLYDDALVDFNRVVKLKPKYKTAYFSRAEVKQKLTDYTGALTDFSKAIALDTNYAEAYFKRARVYSMLSQKDNACNDFNKAHQKGIEDARDIVRKCNNIPFARIPKYAILSLQTVSDDATYGFTVENPVKVGMPIEGGYGNVNDYLDLLRDAQGKPLNYEYLGTCCDYPSKYGGFGMGSLTKYGIKYVNEQGEEEEVYIFLTYYDYENPKIIKGFKTLEGK